MRAGAFAAEASGLRRSTRVGAVAELWSPTGTGIHSIHLQVLHPHRAVFRRARAAGSDAVNNKRSFLPGRALCLC